MLDLDKKPVNGVYKSKGYGFVEFAHHAHALAFLRELNNNPRYNHLTSRPPQKDSGVISRPMIEFCLEDANKVRILKARADLSKKRVEAMRRGEQEGEGKDQGHEGSAKKNKKGGKNAAKQGKQKGNFQHGERKQGNKRGRGSDEDTGQQSSRAARSASSSGDQAGARKNAKRARK
jgi:nucleolar protein 4